MAEHILGKDAIQVRFLLGAPINICMTKIFIERPRRLVTFGCSFTEYFWPTWANIISYDIDVPLYNYGKKGASNQYIFNMLMQADHYLKLDQNDLVMICWTSVYRNDIHKNGHWVTPGCVYHDTDSKTVISDPVGFSIRDFAVIKASYEFLKNKNIPFHFLKMIDFDRPSQDSPEEKFHLSELENIYGYYLNNIQRSFYDVVWNNSLDNKNKNMFAVHKLFKDNHPDILEHFKYIKTVFDHTWKPETEKLVKQKNSQLISLIRNELEVSKDESLIDYNKHADLHFGKSQPISFI